MILHILSLITIVVLVVCVVALRVMHAQAVRQIERESDGWWTCDGCGEHMPPDAENVGIECDLCTACAEELAEKPF